MKILNHRWKIEIITGLFIFLFAYTAISKLYDYTNFKALLGQSPLIGKTAFIAAWLLPAVEIATALLLFFPATKKHGMKVTLGLMALFTLYVAYMLVFVSDLPCSCGGVISSMNWTEHLLFNAALTALAWIGLRLINKHEVFIAINRLSRTPV